MFLFLYCYSCILIIFQYNCVAEDTGGIKRFIIEDELKRAIFGSNKFNPVLQVFEDVNETSQSQMGSNTTSMNMTVMGVEGDQATPPIEIGKRAVFKNHVTFVTAKPTFWWARSMLRTKNLTRPVTVARPSVSVAK